MRPTFRLHVLLVLLTWLYPFPGGAADAEGPVEILCGVGMIKPMEDLAEAFGEENGVKVRVSYGGSGELLGKLATGRAYDVFLPGAAGYLEEAARRGWVAAPTRIDLVYHVPVIAVPVENPARIRGLRDLGKPGVKVALGDPDACAIGRASEVILERAGMAGKVRAHVRTSGASQLLLYLLMKQADAAVIWRDLAALPKAKGKLLVIPIPKEVNAVGTIAAARVSGSERPHKADAFLAFLETSRARDIWRKRGFVPCRK